MLRVQINGRNKIEVCGRSSWDRILNAMVWGGKRFFAYRVGEARPRPEHRFQSYDSAREWLATLDGRGYITIDGVQVLRNWL